MNLLISNWKTLHGPSRVNNDCAKKGFFLSCCQEPQPAQCDSCPSPPHLGLDVGSYEDRRKLLEEQYQREYKEFVKKVSSSSCYSVRLGLILTRLLSQLRYSN